MINPEQETIDRLTERLNKFVHVYHPLHIRARLKDMLPEDIYKKDMAEYITLYEEQVYKPFVKLIQYKIKK